MGEVYRAKDTRLGRDVAIKVLPERLAEDPEALARFETEARAVAALSHPNILGIFDFGRESSVVFAVMELLEGSTLRERLDAGALPFRKCIDYGIQMAEGLAAAHDKGIVHRDLKPENVFVTPEGRIKILDFGLAKSLGVVSAGTDTQSPTLAQATDPGTVLGTVGYMSPEQVRGRGADARSDIFSFGAVTYEMATGKRPFSGTSAVETMNAVLKEEPPEISTIRSVPPEFERIVRHCLEKSPPRANPAARPRDRPARARPGSRAAGPRRHPGDRPRLDHAGRPDRRLLVPPDPDRPAARRGAEVAEVSQRNRFGGSMRSRPSTRARLLEVSRPSSTRCLPSGEMPNVSVGISGSKPASLRRVAAVSWSGSNF